MSTARKIIDWHHDDVGGLAQSLKDLPDGRYVLVPESEFATELSPGDAEQVEFDALMAGIAEAEAGEMVDWSEVRAKLDAMIAGASRSG